MTRGSSGWNEIISREDRSSIEHLFSSVIPEFEYLLLLRRACQKLCKIPCLSSGKVIVFSCVYSSSLIYDVSVCLTSISSLLFVSFCSRKNESVSRQLAID